MTQRTVLIPSDSGVIYDRNFFLQSFYKEGYIVDTSGELERNIDKSRDEIIEGLIEIFCEEDITIGQNMVLVDSAHGALQIDILQAHNHCWFDNIYLCFEPSWMVKVTNYFEELPGYTYPPAEPTGAFRVDDYYIDGMGRLRTNNHLMNTQKMNNIRADLYPGVDVDKLVNSFLDSNENILILVGKPGTGKTTFMKKVLQTMSLKVGNPRSIYTKDMNVLHKSEFWSDTIPESRSRFLVLDDLDKELTPRTEVKANGIVNQLLSLSNGLFESDLKTIITTNLVDEGIDSAILRPGRTFDILNLPYLTLEYAKNLWTTIDNKSEAQWEALFPADVEEITQALYMANLESLEMGNPKDYLTNTSISVRDKYAKA